MTEHEKLAKRWQNQVNAMVEMLKKTERGNIQRLPIIEKIHILTTCINELKAAAKEGYDKQAEKM